MVKVRYTTRCARCREWMLPGCLATSMLGGLWHPACAASYRQRRRELLATR